MAALIAGVDGKFTTAGKNNPQFAGKQALLLGGTFYQDSIRVTTPGWRTEFLTNMGFAIPDTGGELVPRDKMAAALDSADVLIWKTESDEEQAALVADPIVAKLRATTAKRNVFTGKDLAGAIAFTSPLSYPVVADQLPPMLARVLA
jgi:iron complex transport system substrate-binding protein